MKTVPSPVSRLTGKAAPVHVPKSAPTPPGGASIDPELRRRMIAEAAYYRAEARNFVDGYELEDWLEAEAEVDHMLRPSEVETLTHQ